MGASAKRSSMTLFSDAKDHYSHRVRIVLREKNVAVDVLTMEPQKLSQELIDLNPHQSLPTLVDRELVVYEPRVMMEYLDERFPHPPLLPVYPVARAEIRQYMHRLELDLSPLVDTLGRSRGKEQLANARRNLAQELITIAPIFAEHSFFMSPDFSLLDCCLVPILWRLPAFDIHLPQTRQVQPLLDYMQRVFQREAFLASLTDWEKSLRKS